MIVKRTFLAKNYPAGSFKRGQLNRDLATSEYLPSFKWAVVGPGISVAKRTRREAELFHNTLVPGAEVGRIV